MDACAGGDRRDRALGSLRAYFRRAAVHSAGADEDPGSAGGKPQRAGDAHIGDAGRGGDRAGDRAGFCDADGDPHGSLENVPSQRLSASGRHADGAGDGAGAAFQHLAGLWHGAEGVDRHLYVLFSDRHFLRRRPGAGESEAGESAQKLPCFDAPDLHDGEDPSSSAEPLQRAQGRGDVLRWWCDRRRMDLVLGGAGLLYAAREKRLHAGQGFRNGGRRGRREPALKRCGQPGKTLALSASHCI